MQYLFNHPFCSFLFTRNPAFIADAPRCLVVLGVADLRMMFVLEEIVGIEGREGREELIEELIDGRDTILGIGFEQLNCSEKSRQSIHGE